MSFLKFSAEVGDATNPEADAIATSWQRSFEELEITTQRTAECVRGEVAIILEDDSTQLEVYVDEAEADAIADSLAAILGEARRSDPTRGFPIGGDE